MTLQQSINQFIDNISVTDRQEDGIKTSLDNIYYHLMKSDNGLYVERTFTNGSYDRDTIIRPLNDVDIFAVLKLADWQDENGQLPKPQQVLTKIKNFLNDVSEYKDKVKQDRPCVTLQLSDKDFDILPCFELSVGGYQMPNFDLSGWTYTYPEQLYQELEATHRLRNYKVKQVIKSVKYWNRDLDKLILSYHVEEVAISIFNVYDFKNFKEAIEHWFNNASFYLDSYKFKSDDHYTKAKANINSVIEKFQDADEKCADNKEGEAQLIWKEIFGRDFPTIDPAEAKNFAKSISEGALRVGASGALSTSTGNLIGASKGYFGGTSRD